MANDYPHAKLTVSAVLNENGEITTGEVQLFGKVTLAQLRSLAIDISDTAKTVSETEQWPSC